MSDDDRFPRWITWRVKGQRRTKIHIEFGDNTTKCGRQTPALLSPIVRWSTKVLNREAPNQCQACVRNFVPDRFRMYTPDGKEQP